MDDTVARQTLSAHAARAEHTARARGGRWHADGEVASAECGLPGLFGNHAFLLQPDLGSAALDRIDDFFPADRQYLLWSPFPTGDLRDRGLELVGHPPLMYLAPHERTPDPPARLVIEEVTAPAGLATFERTLVEAYPLPEWTDLPTGSAFPAALVGTDVARYWVGSVDGRAVCTAATTVHAGVNLVEWVSTDASHRGRGYGAAVTWAAATASAGLPAVLLASDDGRPVYQRMGFVAMQRWTLWTRLPKSPRASPPRGATRSSGRQTRS